MTRKGRGTQRQRLRVIFEAVQPRTRHCKPFDPGLQVNFQSSNQTEVSGSCPSALTCNKSLGRSINGARLSAYSLGVFSVDWVLPRTLVLKIRVFGIPSIFRQSFFEFSDSPFPLPPIILRIAQQLNGCCSSSNALIVNYWIEGCDACSCKGKYKNSTFASVLSLVPFSLTVQTYCFSISSLCFVFKIEISHYLCSNVFFHQVIARPTCQLRVQPVVEPPPSIYSTNMFQILLPQSSPLPSLPCSQLRTSFACSNRGCGFVYPL